MMSYILLSTPTSKITNYSFLEKTETVSLTNSNDKIVGKLQEYYVCFICKRQWYYKNIKENFGNFNENNNNVSLETFIKYKSNI